MPPKSEKPTRAWGTTYAGTGDLEIARRAVEKVLSDAGMHCRTTRIGAQSVLVEGEQQASWYRVLLRALHQRVRWRIESSGGALCLSSDFRLFRWYSAVIALLWTVIASCFVFDYLNAEKHWLIGPSGALVASGLLVLAVGLMPVVIHLLGALGGRSSERLWLAIVHEVEKVEEKGSLAPQCNVSLRYFLHLIGFFGFALALTLWFVTFSLRDTALLLPRGFMAFQTALAGLIVLMIVTLALMFGRRGFNLRLYPILTGLMTMLSALFLPLSILLPWWMTSRIDNRALGAALRPFGWLPLGVSAVLVSTVAFVFFYYGVYSTPAIRPQMERLHSHREVGTYRLAVGGVSPRPFQVVFFLTWLLLTGLSLGGLTFLIACAAQGVVPLFEQRELQLVHLCSQALSAAFGLAPGNRILSFAISGIWLLFALAGVGLLLLSVGQLLLRRRAGRRRLATAAERPFPRRWEMEDMLVKLRRAGHLPPICLALSSGRLGGAGAERFGVWRAERYVEVSEECLDLPAAELEALLAHECAHHYLGHLAVRSFALWLGRLSLAGDGFVFALLDSFDYEKQADRAAVGTLGAPPSGLEKLLDRLGKDEARGRPSVSPMTSLNPPLAERWSLFLKQYSGALKYHYWHPATQERIEALRDLE